MDDNTLIYKNICFIEPFRLLNDNLLFDNKIIISSFYDENDVLEEIEIKLKNNIEENLNLIEELIDLFKKNFEDKELLKEFKILIKKTLPLKFKDNDFLLLKYKN